MTNKLFVGGISVSMLLLVFALIMIFNNTKRKPLSIDPKLLIVTLLVVLHSVMSYLKYGNVTILHLLVISIFYLTLTLILPSQIEENSFYDIYKKVAVLAVIGLLYHLIAIFVLGKTVNPLTFFPGLLGHSATDHDRPMSFFSEPSHLASYFLPLFILSLYKKDWKWTVISLFSIVMSFSMLGLATSAVVGVFYLLTQSGIKHRFLYIIIIAGAVFYLSSLPIFSYFFERGERIASESDASAMVRVLYGFELIKTLDFNTLLCGIGAGNNIAFFHDEDIFYNSLTGIIIDYGVILATVFYYIFFILYSIKQKPLIIAFQICTLALLASSTLYFTAAFFFQYTFYFVYAEKHGQANKRDILSRNNNIK